MRIHGMQGIDSSCLGLGDDLEGFTHTSRFGTSSSFGLCGIRPHSGNGDDVLNWSAAQDAGRQLKFEYLFRVDTECPQVVST